MKREYIKPLTRTMGLHLESMLAASTDRIPVGGNEVKPSATNKYNSPWDCQHWDESSGDE